MHMTGSLTCNPPSFLDGLSPCSAELPSSIHAVAHQYDDEDHTPERGLLGFRGHGNDRPPAGPSSWNHILPLIHSTPLVTPRPRLGLLTLYPNGYTQTPPPNTTELTCALACSESSSREFGTLVAPTYRSVDWRLHIESRRHMDEHLCAG